MFAFIDNFLDRRIKEREEYQKKLDFYTELFRCGEVLWKKIEDLEDHKVYVEEHYNGTHNVRGFQMTVKLNWRGFLFELRSVRPRNYFERNRLLEDVSNRLSEKWNDASIKYNIWEPLWYKDGVRITGIERVQGLTAAMLLDFNNLVPKTTEAEANKFAEEVVESVINREKNS